MSEVKETDSLSLAPLASIRILSFLSVVDKYLEQKLLMTANRNPANYHLYDTLMEALIADEDAMDKEVKDRVKDTKESMIVMMMKTMMMMKALQLDQTRKPHDSDASASKQLPSLTSTGWQITVTRDVVIDSSMHSSEPESGHSEHFSDDVSKQDERHISDLKDTDNAHIPKDLEYLLAGDKERKTALSISKLKAARYQDFGLEELVPSLWVKSERDYDISAAYGITHWWFSRKQFYINKHSEPSDREAVRSHMRILSVIRVKTFKKYGYNYLREIILRRADYKEYKISEKDFKNLHPNDFEDLYLLNIQDKLNHLSKSDKIHLHTAVNMWIRNLVIRNRVGDLQLGIESYQTKLNLERPNWDATDYFFKEDYTIVPKPRVVIYKDRNDQRKLMRLNEIHKFSDGTLTRVMEKLDHMVKDFHLFEYNKGMETRKCNILFDAQKIQKNPIFQLSVDILRNTNFFRAFSASASVPAVYTQQFWNSMKYDEKTEVYCCQVDEQWFNLSADLFRKALDITPVDPAYPFELPLHGDTVIDFVNQLGYHEPIEFVSNIRVNYAYQPWREILTLINQCLTGKTSGDDKPRHPVLQMLWDIVTQTNVDHAELLWEEFTQGIQTFFSHKASHKASLKDPKKKVVPLLIPYRRFTKMIIYYLGSTSDVHKRPESPCHLPRDDFLLGNLMFVSKGETSEVFGMEIPKQLITQAIQQSSYYPKYLEICAPPKKPTTTTPVKPTKPPSSKQPKSPTKKPSKRKLPQKPFFQLVDEDDEAQQESVPQGEGDDPALELAKKMSLDAHQEKGEGEGADADIERAIKLSLDPSFLPQGRAPVGGVTIRDPVSETTPKLPEVVGKGKAIVTEEQVAHSLIDLSKKKRTTDQFILVRRDQAPHDSTTGPSSQPEDDTSEKVIHESSSTSDSERTESETEAAAPKGDKEQGEVASSTVTSGVSIPVSTQDQAGSDPEKAHEALAGPDPEPMQEDQTGSDSGKVHVSLAGPNPEHMDDEFLATAYPKVHENLKLITDERVIEDNPESHSGSMSSMKNLEDTDNFGDQFLYDKPTEDDQEKSKVVDESDSTIPDPSHQTVTSTPPVIAPVTDFSSPKPSSLVTPPPINTEATTITTSLPEITPFIALQLRVARLEQEMSEVKKTDHSADVLASIKSQVPTVVDKYLGTKLDDALLRILERHTADLIEKYSVLPGPESIKNQESEKSPKEIIRIKKEQGEEKQDSTYSIRSTDKVALEEFDLKSALFKHMNKNKTANRNPANYHLYHALMEALIADEDAMDKEVIKNPFFPSPSLLSAAVHNSTTTTMA
ncbi:hypothetical protein Tco_0637550 [Tanacetum coccineum]